MSERVFLKTRFTPAGVGSQVRNKVGGFLRYMQYRDHHPTKPALESKTQIAGLLKYVAYRDRASYRAELFGPEGRSGAKERKAFAEFVSAALENSRPQLFPGRDGQPRDRRKAVHRMILSPERAAGLDLRQLILAGTARLEKECGGSLRWMAAIHRNTDHHHIHFVLAGMRDAGDGRFVRVDITKRRLAALKKALVLEAERQRGERTPSFSPFPAAAVRSTAEATDSPTSAGELLKATRAPLASVRREPQRLPALRWTSRSESVIALRTVARRYHRRMQRELEESYRQTQWEHTA